MPLTGPEKADVAKAFLTIYGEDTQSMGKTLAYMKQFSVGSVDLLTETLNQATTWPFFLANGTDIFSWKSEVTRIYNIHLAEISP
jgi:hypothetical protein